MMPSMRDYDACHAKRNPAEPISNSFCKPPSICWGAQSDQQIGSGYGTGQQVIPVTLGVVRTLVRKSPCEHMHLANCLEFQCSRFPTDIYQK